MAHNVRTDLPTNSCSTCGGLGSIPWMVESDPNADQEPDAGGRVPCPDCPTPPAVDQDGGRG